MIGWVPEVVRSKNVSNFSDGPYPVTKTSEFGRDPPSIRVSALRCWYPTETERNNSKIRGLTKMGKFQSAVSR